MNDLPERIRVAAGATIYATGDRSDRAFLVLGGRVALGGHSAAFRRAGEVFGELALVDDRAREGTATALSDCDLLSFSASALAPGISELDPLLRVAIASIVARLSVVVAPLPDAVAQPAPPALLPLWTERVEEAREMLTFQHELRAGLARGELELFFQPIVHLASGWLAGFEALVRWRHPGRGLLLPGEFIPLAEKAGLIGEVTTFCLREVGRRFPSLRSAAGAGRTPTEPLFVTVNITASDLAHEAFAASAVMLLGEGGVEPEEVRLEITESVLMTDVERCARTMRNCQDQGFLIAIDDFGIGYSSLHMLSSLPLSILKMDRSFCATAAASEAGQTVIAAILRLGHELKLRIVAEGIETTQQAALLRTLDCDYGQGFLFGGPLDHARALLLAAGRNDQIAPAA